MRTPDQIAVALVDALNRSTGVPALRIFARPRYLYRETNPRLMPDGSVKLTLRKYGWNYKFHGRKPSKTPPPADTAAVKVALNAALVPGLSVQTVTDCDTYISLNIKENE